MEVKKENSMYKLGELVKLKIGGPVFMVYDIQLEQVKCNYYVEIMCLDNYMEVRRIGVPEECLRYLTAKEKKDFDKTKTSKKENKKSSNMFNLKDPMVSLKPRGRR